MVPILTESTCQGKHTVSAGAVTPAIRVVAYAITIHKSQGSEFPAVVIPLATQQYLLLRRNLVYTGITRGKKLVVVVGQRRALPIAVRNNRTEQRFSGLLARLISQL